MKLRLLSDLHIEGYKYKYEHLGEDALVLAGDIHTRNRHHEILDQIPAYVQVIFVAGNHEYYHGNFNTVNAYLAALNQPFDKVNPNNSKLDNGYANFHFLNNTRVTLDDVEFFGGTMFTDFGLYGEAERWFAEQDAAHGIADFHYIETDGWHYEKRKWTVADHKAEHKKFVREFELWLKDTEGKKRVVVTHFMPTPKATHERFRHSLLNPYFCVDMERYIGWEGLWLFGHTHDSFDQMLGDTRLVCNPKGYGVENQYGFIRDLIINI